MGTSFTPIVPHPYNGLSYGHALYGLDSVGTVEPSSVTDDVACPPVASGVIDELFCGMKRFFWNLLWPRGVPING